MAFSQTLRNFQKIMLEISNICLRIFFENVSILTKIPILEHPPSNSHTRNWRIYTCIRIGVLVYLRIYV